MVSRRDLSSVNVFGKVVGLSNFLRISALFTLRLFWLVFNNRWFWSIGIRSFFRLWFQIPIRRPVLSPARPPSLSSGSWSIARCPTSTSEWCGLIYLVLIFRYELSLPHLRALSGSTSGAGSSLSVIHSPILGGCISAVETSTTSARHSRTCVLETSTASSTSADNRATLHYYVPASKSLTAWSLTSSLETLAESTWPSALKIPFKSAGASILSPLNVLIRALT